MGFVAVMLILRMVMTSSDAKTKWSLRCFELIINLARSFVDGLFLKFEVLHYQIKFIYNKVNILKTSS